MKEYGQGWEQIILEEKFACNDGTNRTTGRSPFEVVYEFHQRGFLELRDLKGYKGINGHVDDFSQLMKEVHDQVKKTLGDTNQKLRAKRDEGRKDLQFEVGDLVMVFL